MNTRSDLRSASECARALQALCGASPAALQSLKDDQATIEMILGPGLTDITVHWLALDAQPTGSFPSLSDPPTPLQLERAIEHVDDFVMPLAAQTRLSFALVLNVGSRLWQPPTRAGIDWTVDRRSIEEVKLAFQHLAAIAEGRPATLEDPPTDAMAITSLLIVREAMHHLKFNAIQSLSV